MDANANRVSKSKYRSVMATPGAKKRIYVTRSPTQAAPRPVRSLPGGLTRDFLLSRFSPQKDVSLLPDWLKSNTMYYSETPIPPESSKEFPLPMDKSIMPPRSRGRRDEGQPGFKSHAEPGSEDRGIVTRGENEGEDLRGRAGVPLWFHADSDSEPAKKPSKGDTGAGFSFEDMAKGQDALEEEKRRFFSKADKSAKSESPLEIEKDCVYSSVDERFEQRLKQQQQTAASINKLADIFVSENAAAQKSAEDPTALGQAVPLGALEAGLVCDCNHLNNGDEDKEETEEVPAWNAFSAEEIQRHTREHPDGWGIESVTLKATKEPEEELLGGMEKLAVNEEVDARKDSGTINAPLQALDEEREHPTTIVKEESENPFCPSYLRVSESDKVWHYKDMQGLIRGPFSASEMNMWLKAGYFPRNLLIRFGDSSTFVLLESFVPSAFPPTPAVSAAPTYVSSYASLSYRPVLALPQAYIVQNMARYPQQTYAPTQQYGFFPSQVRAAAVPMYYYQTRQGCFYPAAGEGGFFSDGQPRRPGADASLGFNK